MAAGGLAAHCFEKAGGADRARAFRYGREGIRGAELTPAGRADHHHPIGDLEIWRQHGPGGNDALAPDARWREKHGTHSDQSSASDGHVAGEDGVVSAIGSVGEFGDQLHISECIVRRVASPQNPGGRLRDDLQHPADPTVARGDGHGSRFRETLV